MSQEAIKEGFNLEKIKEFKLNISDYKMNQILGCGAFGMVRLAKGKDGVQCACKALKKHELIKSQQIEHVKNEVFIMSHINHPFTVTQKGQTQDNKQFYIFLEFVQGGELFTQLRSVGRFDEVKARFYASQTALVFEHLHSKEIIQRDLKPENMLINSDGQLKITDFGFAKQCPTKTQTLCGTPQQIAPEIIMNKGHGKPVDWWALGILIQEMIHGIDPFDAADAMEIQAKILAGKIRFSRTFPSDAKSLVKHLVTADLSKRQGNLKNGPDDVKNHRWFKTVDFVDLYWKKDVAPYIPKIASPSDCSNFESWPERTSKVAKVEWNMDPFKDWE